MIVPQNGFLGIVAGGPSARLVAEGINRHIVRISTWLFVEDLKPWLVAVMLYVPGFKLMKV